MGRNKFLARPVSLLVPGRLIDVQERTISNSFPFIDQLNMCKKKQGDSSSYPYDNMKNKLKTIVNIKPEEDTSGVSTKNEV